MALYKKSTLKDMSSPFHHFFPHKKPYNTQLRFLQSWIYVAFIVLVCERLWLAFWKVVACMAVLGTVILLNVLQPLSPVIHSIVLLGFFCMMGWLGYRGLRELRLPTRLQVLRRIEQDLHLNHGPLYTVLDTLAIGKTNPVTQYLWQQHRERMSQFLSGLRVGLPRAPLGLHDPFALRFLCFLLLFVSSIHAGDKWYTRIVTGFVPAFASSFTPQYPPIIDAWITPPEYTKLPSIFLPTPEQLKSNQQQKISVPQGSTIEVRVSGISTAPQIRLQNNVQTLVHTEKNQYTIKTQISQPSKTIILESEEKILTSWTIQFVVDTPPEITLTQTPTVTPHQAIQLDFQAKDDYQIQEVTATLKSLHSEYPDRELEVYKGFLGGSKEITGPWFSDLTSSPLAGLPVELRLHATDTLNQKTTTQPISFILPERTFTHPVAQDIARIRKKILHRDGEKETWFQELIAVITKPQRFNQSTSVFLNVNVAAKRVLHDPSAHKPTQVPELLWQVMMDLEDNSMVTALEKIRRIYSQLKSALENEQTSEQEIENLIQAFKNAFREFVQAIQQQAQVNQSNLHNAVPFLPQNSTTPKSLTQAIQQLQEYVTSWDRESAQSMLDDLMYTLENLQTRPVPQESVQAFNLLQDFLDRQQQLLDQTYRESVKDQTKNSGTEQTDSVTEQEESLHTLRAQQSQLQADLLRFLEQFALLPPSAQEALQSASESMQKAEESLQQGGDLNEVLEYQQQALTALQEGLEYLVEHLLSQMGSTGVFWMSNPFGQHGSTMGTDNMPISDENKRTKAKEILEFLRKWSTERERLPFEREYFKRLLQQF